MNKINLFFKKLNFLFVVSCVSIAFTSCNHGNTENEVIFSLAQEEHESYVQQIEYITNKYYWTYDTDSLVFSPYEITSNEDIISACGDIDLDISQFAGKDAISGRGNLIHYNGDYAGVINFIFIKDQLVGSYYNGGFDFGVYSLRQRNPFLGNGNFDNYENWTKITEGYQSFTGDLPSYGIVATYNNSKYGNIIVCINENSLIFYNVSNNKVTKCNSIIFANDEVSGATYMQVGNKNLLAVLLNKSDNASLSRVVFYNDDGTEESVLNLSNNEYSCIDSDGENLLLFSGSAIEFYSSTGGNFALTHRALLKNTITNSHIVDIDNNGQNEFILTDGKDIYIYQQKESGLEKIWSTHLGVDNLYNSISSGDLNGDGIKEVYIYDSTGTTIRYILTPKGLQSSNEDILYGQRIFTFDFNHDGKTDYLNITNDENINGTLYVSQ